MNQLRKSIDTLNHYKQSLGSVDAYLSKFKDTEGYRQHPCISSGGCSEAKWQALIDQNRFGSATQQRATDSVFRGIDQQQSALTTDADRLMRLQAAANGAEGQLQAIGYANQLASHQSNQLLQIRALLLAQQTLIATRNQALADREAKEAAASDYIRSGKFQPSPPEVW